MELEQLKENYIVTGMLTKGSKVDVRFVAEKPPFENAVAIEPCVEDAYLYLMNGKVGE
jgi:hypothetical protein